MYTIGTKRDWESHVNLSYVEVLHGAGHIFTTAPSVAHVNQVSYEPPCARARHRLAETAIISPNCDQ